VQDNAMPSLDRHSITSALEFAATPAWQSYGEAETVANSYTVGLLTLSPAPAARNDVQ
jgi:hypothetical protein